MKLPLEAAAERYQLEMYRAAFAVSKNRMDAEDAVQDALLRYYRGKEDYQSEEHIRAWLLRCAINRSKDQLRSFWRRNRTGLDAVQVAAPAQKLDNALLEAVMSLPLKQRETVFLHYYSGYSVKEIGKMMQRRENTVKSDLMRARRTLKTKLKEEWEYE